MAVSIVACKDYQKDTCLEAIDAVLAPLGGLAWVKKGMRIVIKANLVAAAKPDKAVTTHPTLLAALTQRLVDRGATVIIGDSPGNLYNAAVLNRVYNLCGLQEAEAAGAMLNRNFTQKTAEFPDALVAKQFAYTAYLDDADAIISFCKLKSHGMMSLSAATKNFFGAVPGTTKPEYHFRYPDPLDFSGMIIDLNRYFHPRLYLVDAVEAMEGNGPTAGTPVYMGALIAGADCHEVDLLCCKLIGLQPASVPTLSAAVKYGLSSGKIEDVSVIGDAETFVNPDFQRIEHGKGMQFQNALPGFLGKGFSRVAKFALQSSPKLKKAECVGCGLCANVCPTKAIEIRKNQAVICKKKCIRCFCCQEFCPKGAMKVHRPWIARLLNGRR